MRLFDYFILMESVTLFNFVVGCSVPNKAKLTQTSYLLVRIV